MLCSPFDEASMIYGSLNNWIQSPLKPFYSMMLYSPETIYSNTKLCPKVTVSVVKAYGSSSLRRVFGIVDMILAISWSVNPYVGLFRMPQRPQRGRQHPHDFFAKSGVARPKTQSRPRFGFK